MRQFARFIATVAASLVLTSVGGAGVSGIAPPNLPDGWRLPSTDELSNTDRNGSVSRFSVVVGDFNGDGESDQAFLLVNTKDNMQGLWVYLSRGHDRYFWIPLNMIRSPGTTSETIKMSVDLLHPGVQDYECIDGDAHCDIHSRKSMTLDLPAVLYFRPTHERSFFYWDRRTSHFRQVWINE